jgi:protein gp37
MHIDAGSKVRSIHTLDGGVVLLNDERAAPLATCDDVLCCPLCAAEHIAAGTERVEAIHVETWQGLQRQCACEKV